MLSGSTVLDASHAGNTSSNLVGVTAATESGFGRALAIEIRALPRRWGAPPLTAPRTEMQELAVH